MKPYLLILVWLAVGFLLFAGKSGAVCPEAPNDNGICDSMYVEVWPGDEQFQLPGHFARFPIYITHDNPEPVDSIAAFVLPFCYTHNNSSKYCSLSSYWNQILWGTSQRPRSIFRHLPSNDNPVVRNWMMDQYQAGREWNGITLDLDGSSHFWLFLIPSGVEDQRFGPGSRVLLATMTFKLQDSMMVCVDSCFNPTSSRLAFSRSDAVTYIPRHNLPKCQNIGFESPPLLWLSCPYTQAHHTNGDFIAPGVEAQTYDMEMIVSLSANFVGQGVENVRLINVSGLPGWEVRADVAYHVNDHCQEGGAVCLVATGEYGNKDTCYFGINLSNTSPELAVPDSIFALGDHISGFPVSASDMDNDAVSTAMNTFWFAQDSLHPPVNSPSYSGGNPGSFSWLATASDAGTWMASFSATDVCGKADTARVRVLVGMTSCGDCTHDSIMDVADVVYLINYLFKGGTAPDPICRGDVNCSGDADIGDVVLLINYLYKGGTAPCFGCCG